MQIRGIYLFIMLFLAAGSGVGAEPKELAKQVLIEINAARKSPQAYAEYLKELRNRFRGKNVHFNGEIVMKTEEGIAAVDEAVRFLSQQEPLPPLDWSPGLAAAAADLAAEQEKTGRTGHQGKSSGGMRQRIERHGEWSGRISENIGYGPTEARLMVMQLIIDDGVPYRGHRKNIFDSEMRVAGVACRRHPGYRNMCVIDFAGGFRLRH